MPPAITSLASPGHDAPARVGDRLHARGAVAVHGHPGHPIRDAGAQRGDARDVRGLGGLRAVPEHDVVEPRGVQLGAREQLGDGDAPQLVGGHAREHAAGLGERRSHARQDPARHPGHGRDSEWGDGRRRAEACTKRALWPSRADRGQALARVRPVRGAQATPSCCHSPSRTSAIGSVPSASSAAWKS